MHEPHYVRNAQVEKLIFCSGGDGEENNAPTSPGEIENGARAGPSSVK